MSTPTDNELRSQVATREALRDAFSSYGMRFTEADNVDIILGKLSALGVTATVGPLGLELAQGSTEMSLAKACATLRQQNPTLFASDTRFDQISSLEDFHGLPSEVIKAKSQWVSEHGLAAFEALPRTRAKAALQSVAPSATMRRQEWLAIPLKERARLMDVLGVDTVGKIMARK
jgi:hypothetical protein